MTKHTGKNRKITDADHGLDQSQFRSLNVRFYNGFHHDLITARLGVLCLQHERPELVETHLLSGVSWGKLRLTIDPEDEYQDALRRVAELELVSLRQHAAETLFRLFWVHAHQEPCPWLALARLRRPGQLIDAASRYLSGQLWSDDDDRRQFHTRACCGTAELQEGGRLDKAGLEASMDTVALWTAVAAEAVRDAPLYNAYKHGLAILPSAPFTMTIGGPEGGHGEISMEATSGFTFLGSAYSADDHHRRWQLTREPVDFDCTAAEIAIFSTIVQSILSAGALERRVSQTPRGILVLTAEHTPDKLRSHESSTGIFITRFRETLAYFEEGAASANSGRSTSR